MSRIQVQSYTVSDEGISSPLLPRQQFVLTLAINLGIPFLLTAFLSIVSANHNSPIQIFLAFLLFAMTWNAFQLWKTNRSFGLLIFALVSGFHTLYFGVALFLGNRIAPVWYSSTALVSEESVTKALFMVVLGMSSIGLGMRLPWNKIMPRLPQVSFQLDDGRWDYVRGLLILGAILSLLPNLAYILGEAGRQLIYTFQDTIPLLASLILLKKYFEGRATQLDKILLFTYIVFRVAVGLGSGWSGSVFYFGLALGLVYYLEQKRIPIRMLLLLVLFSLFIQPSKGEFRATYWYGDGDETQTDVLTRVTFWLEESATKWVEAFNDPTHEKLNDYLNASILRVSLLNHAANVHDRTPEVVPYQGLSLYRFAVAGLVPRFLWPSKPSANDANRFFQVAYDVTPADRLGTVSIAIGFLTESYIALGWFGVVVTMILVGGIYSTIQRAFFSNLKDPILPAIGIVVILRLLDIEAQFGRYVVAIVQTILYCYIFLLPLTLKKRTQLVSNEAQQKIVSPD